MVMEDEDMVKVRCEDTEVRDEVWLKTSFDH